MNGELHYDWERFWVPREGNIVLAGDGYPIDPTTEFNQRYYPDIVSIDALADIPCLVLLGEPGTGKSTALEALEEDLGEHGEMVLRFDLGTYSSDALLVQEVFENEEILAWIDGDDELVLILDSLDEAKLTIKTVRKLLISRLQQLPLSRLRLRIASRTAVWPSTLERDLRALWDEDAVSVYEIYPLRRADVQEAAERNELNVDGFLDEINRVRAVPLAIKPITLRFLLRTFQDDGRLPESQVELYRHGCRLLSADTRDRYEAELAGQLDPDARMKIARRVAVITIFGNNTAIYNAPEAIEVPEEHVTLSDLRGSDEYAREQGIDVTQMTIQEVLNTGLFSSRGDRLMGWAHRTYAEFLAADYVVQHKMPREQIMGLLAHPDDPHGRLIPQLHETAAWIASMRPDVFHAIIEVDPEVLLRSDVAGIDDDARHTLATSLLALYDAEVQLRPDYRLRRHFSKLTHEELPELLRAYILDEDKSLLSRQMATEIAIECGVDSLQDDLADIALDPTQPYSLREDAAMAVVERSDSATQAQLMPLAREEAGDDPYDLLKGYGLMAAWPEHIDADELFALVRAPQRELAGGAYQRFLNDHLVQNLRPTDLPTALRWVARTGSRYDLHLDLRRLTDAIVVRGWEELLTEGVIEAFVEATVSRLIRFEPIIGDDQLAWMDRAESEFTERLRKDDVKRQRILDLLLPIMAGSDKDISHLLAGYRTQVVFSKDVPWLLNRLKQKPCNEKQALIARLIRHVTNPRDIQQVESVHQASKQNELLANAVQDFFDVVELDSPQAERMRERYRNRREEEEVIQLLDPPPEERIAHWLEQCEAGNVLAWEALTADMTLEPDSVRYDLQHVVHPDLTTLFGWETASEAIRQRIVEAAVAYVVEQPHDRDELLIGQNYQNSTLAGYKALRLLLKERSDALDPLTDDVWVHWMPLILSYPVSATEYKSLDRALRHIAYDAAPGAFLDVLKQLVTTDDVVSVAELLDGLWDDRIATALLEIILEQEVPPSTFEEILFLLLRDVNDDALQFARSLVENAPDGNESARERSIRAAYALSVQSTESWDVVWKGIQSDPSFGKKLAERWAQGNRGGNGSLVGGLTSQQIAALYVWLTEQFPHDEDPNPEGAYWVTPRIEIGRFRDSLLQYLVREGAHETIADVAEQFPDAPWLRRAVLQAMDVARSVWAPYSPEVLLALAHERQLRVVQNAEQLLTVVIESLDRLQKRLQEVKSPAAIDLWSEWPDMIEQDGVQKRVTRYRPKDENRLSDYVARFLEEDLLERGIIINREVQIRRGDETDIFVEAIPDSQDDDAHGATIRVVVETKGSWHRELHDAIKTQLVDRYLRTPLSRHGVYLVGWFNCEKWDDGDYRKGYANRNFDSIEEAQEQLTEQAVALSAARGVDVRTYVLDARLH